jgi:hypothetical protein
MIYAVIKTVGIAAALVAAAVMMVLLMHMTNQKLAHRCEQAGGVFAMAALPLASTCTVTSPSNMRSK